MNLTLAQYLDYEQRRKHARFKAQDSRTTSELESDSGHAPLGQKKVQGQAGPGFLVRTTSIRKRLLDEDNLCAKYSTDLLRYCGAIPDDSPQQVKIETSQRKAEKGEEEHTLIEVYNL